jgi:hypothetical protein
MEPLRFTDLLVISVSFERQTETLRDWFMSLWKLTSWKFMEHARKLGTQAGFLYWSMETGFFSEKLVFVLKALN